MIQKPKKPYRAPKEIPPACPRCGSTKPFRTGERGPHVGLWCSEAGCGAWIKWVGVNDEIRKAQDRDRETVE